MPTPITTDVLIIGAGPAGAVAAILLARLGVKTLMINKYRSTSPGPRAHITNQRTMEIMRDLGLEAAAQALSTPQSYMGEHVYATSLAGEELGRIRSWQTHPISKAEHDLASPSSVCDLPQLYFEPLLANAASHSGAELRFMTEYHSLVQDENGVTATLQDRLTGTEYQVCAKYLIGADGARSQVAQDIGLPFEGQMATGVTGAINVEFSADLSSLTDHRRGDMYWILQPGTGVRGHGIGVLRMVRPWKKWVAVWGYDKSRAEPALDEASVKEIVYKLLGTRDIPVSIDAVSTWSHNRQYALRNTNGRVFCIGDAVHRHPPMGGLGLNTSVQDAYNLCWKLALVIQGQAGTGLLDSYDSERSPIARQIVDYAFGCGSKMEAMFQALGIGRHPDEKEMADHLQILQATTPDSAQARTDFRRAMDDTVAGFGGGYGVEMNQRYRSTAIVSDGSAEPPFVRNPEQYYQASTRPGSHLPHAWLTRAQRQVSTLDLCGQGRFTLLTGLSGIRWVKAAQEAATALGIELTVQVIGPGQTYVDSYGDYARMREIAEDGALLVRPDLFIAWRAHDASESQRANLLPTLRSILGLS